MNQLHTHLHTGRPHLGAVDNQIRICLSWHSPAPRRIPPVCCQFPCAVRCISKSRDLSFALFFGAQARMHTMCIVVSGCLRRLAKRVPTTEAVAVYWLSTEASDTQHEGLPHSEPGLFSSCQACNEYNLLQRSRVWNHRLGQWPYLTLIQQDRETAWLEYVDPE